MKLKSLMALAIALLCSAGAWADDVFKDVTSTYLTNADFEGTYTIKSGTGVSSDRAIYQPNGWTVTWSSFTTNECSALKNGDKQWSFFSGYSSAPSGSNQTYWTRLHKDGNGQRLELSQTIRIKGTYKLSAVAFRNENKGNTYIQFNSDTYRSAVSGNNTWESLSVSYTSDGTTDTKITCGAWHGNNNSNYIAGFDNVKLEWNLTQSLTDLLTEANNFYTAEGDSYTALKAVIDATDPSDTDADELEAQYNALTAALALAKDHRKPWLAAWTTANTNYGSDTYVNVTGSEKTELKTEIDKAEPSTADGYDTAKGALETANTAFTAAKTNYDKYALETANAAAVGVSSVPTLDDASNYSEKLKALIVLEDAAVTAGYTKDATKVIDAWNVASGVKNTWTLQNAGTNDNNHWSGETKTYYNKYSDAGFTMSASKTVSLPAGSYVLKAAARCNKVNEADQFYLGVTVDGNLTKEIYTSTGGGSGLGIDKTGAANYTEADDTYANSNNGYGWEWRFVPFVLTETKEVQLKITANILATGWVSFSDIQLLTTDENTAIFEQIYNTAKASAESARDHATYINVDGKEKKDLTDAIGAAVTSTIDGYSTQKTALDDAIAAFVGAKTNYDDLATAISEANTIVTNSVNVGDGPFQVPTSIKTTLDEAKEAAEGIKNNVATTSTVAATAAETLNNAIETYNTGFAAAELNAPAEGDVFNVMITTNDNYGFKDKPLTFNSDNVSGANFYKAYGVTPYRAQQITFTKVSGNQYTLSMVNADGNRVYIRTNAPGKGGNGNTSQIRLTTVPENALAVQVIPSSTTNGVYTLKNTEANALLGCQDADSNPSGGLYTVGSHNIFTITAASKPSVPVAVSSGKWATRIFPFAVTEIPDGLEAYMTSSVSGSSIVLSEPLSPIPANTPVLLKASKDVNETLQGYGTAKEDSYTSGLLTGFYTEIEIPEGRYVLQTKDDVQAFYRLADSATANQVYRAYLTVPAAGDVKAFYFDFDDATAISETLAPTVRAGEGPIYNLAGQKMSKLQKGVNIVNGKKVLVK